MILLESMHTASRRLRCRPLRGFTLVELLVVIGIIAVLISILLPTLAKAREQSHRAQCLSNQKQIVLAIMMYAGDNRGTLPGPVGPAVIDPYTSNAVPPATTSLLWQWGDTGTSPGGYGNMASTQQGFWECHMLSSTLLLQNYLGGVDSRNVWRCPSSTNIFNAPIAPPTSGSGTFQGKIPGFGYKLNNSQNTALNHGWNATTPITADCVNGYFFGDWNVESTTPTLFAVAEWPPKKITAIMAPIGPSQAIVGNSYITGTVSSSNPTGATVTLIKDASKTWLTCDLDGRNMGSDQSSTWGIVTCAASTTVQKNAFAYQPVHNSGGIYGRNYAYLDGHAEYLLMNDWPNASYEYP